MTAGAQPLPMFPLGTVLFPHQLLPLHVFEERYRTLTRRCLEGDRRFGVALIERGSEVGGGDLRVDVGTVAEITQAARLPDGRWLLETVGVERFRVVRWLPDDPHPWAEVVTAPDRAGDGGELTGLVEPVAERLRHLLALRAELGDPAPAATFDLADDPIEASWQAAALAGLTPLDALQVLGTDRADDRLRLLAELLEGAIELARARFT